MTLEDAIKDTQRSKYFIFASKAKELNLKLEWLKDTYGNKSMVELCQ